MKRKVMALGVLALPMLTSCRWIAAGDSITFLAKDEMHNQLGGDGAVDGDPMRGPYEPGLEGDGETTFDAIARLAPGIDVGGYLIVQDDGTPYDYHSYGAFMDHVEAVVRDDVCIVWVTPWTAMNRPRDAEITQAIYDFRSQRSAVAPWGDIVANSGRDGELAPDTVHPSAWGNVVLVDAIARAMEGC